MERALASNEGSDFRSGCEAFRPHNRLSNVSHTELSHSGRAAVWLPGDIIRARDARARKASRSVDESVLELRSAKVER